MPRRKRVPPMPSRKLVKLLLQAGAEFDREGKGDHSIFRRVVGETVLKAPVRVGQRELRPEYCLMVFRQLGLSDEEIDAIL